VLPELGLEVGESAVQLAPTRAGFRGSRQVVGECSRVSQILPMILVLLHHHRDRHVGHAAATGADQREQDALLLGEMALHGRMDSLEVLGEPDRAHRLVGVHLLDLLGQRDQAREIPAQGLIARDLMRDALVRRGGEIIGASPEMARLRREIELVAQSDFTVLITGETGVGKELVARAIQSASHRRDQSLIYVNCAALPETLAESELFGHLRGAFTGASSDRPGKFEVADGGTLFLDEIGELPLAVQPKLLRALQQGEIQRVGADRTISVDVRLLAATNRELGEEVKAGRFRADLYHRLNVYPLAVPPLRERRGDIPLLAGYFCDLARRRLGLGPVRLAASALDALEQYSWPGNVRELENVISRVVLKASAAIPRGEPVVLSDAHLRPELSSESVPIPERSPAALTRPRGQVSMREFVREKQRAYVQQALEDHHGNVAAAARALGMDRGNLYHLTRRLGLVRARQSAK
jgi:anaerobic nitric oxide reductase transcription regulator